MPGGVAGDPDEGTVGPGAVILHGEILGVGLGEAFDVAHVGQAVAVDQIQRGEAETVPLGLLRETRLHGGIVPEDRTVVQPFPVDAAVLGIGPVEDGHGRDAPVALPGEERSVLAGEVEAGAGEAFEEIVRAVKSPLADGRSQGVAARDEDLVPPGDDDEGHPQRGDPAQDEE